MKSSAEFDDEIEKIVKFAQSFYELNDDLHGYGHVVRVVKLAQYLCTQIPANLFVVLASAWLHDIGRKEEHLTGEHHAIISSRLSKTFLHSIKIPNEIIQQICHCIQAHSFSIGGKAQTLEAQIISDADKLDALGAIGIYRVCAYQGQKHEGVEAVIQHCDDKLYKLADLMYLEVVKKWHMRELKKFENSNMI